MGILFGNQRKEFRSESYSGWIDDERFWSDVSSSQSEAGAAVTAQTTKNFLAAFACISLRARTIASLRAYIGRYVGSNRFEDVPDHHLNALLDGQVNPDTNEFNFFESLVNNLDLHGNFYAIKQRTVKTGELKYLWQIPNPNTVQVKRSKNGLILDDYSYAKPGTIIYIVQDGEGRQKKYSSKQILHVANMSDGAIVGTSQISIYRESVGIALAQQKFVGKFYDGGTFPSGLLSIDGRISDNRENFTKAMQQQWSELGKNRKVAVLEEGMKYTPLNMSMADAEMVASREYQAKEICGWFGVPPHMVGLPVSTSYNSLEQENTGFKTRCIFPLGERIAKAMTNSLLSAEERKSGLRVLFNYDTLLRADIKSRGTYWRKMLETGVSPNTIMARENLPPVDGGDQSFVPANLLPLNVSRETIEAI